MLYWQGKTWLKIISITLVIAFLAYDLAWATDFSSISRKKYASNPEPLSKLLIDFNNKLRLPMGFADKGFIRYLDDKALRDSETSIGDTPAVVLSDRVADALDALKAPTVQPAVERRVTNGARTNVVKRNWLTTLLLSPLAAFGIVGGIGGPGLRYKEHFPGDAEREATSLGSQLKEQANVKNQIKNLDLFSRGFILARIMLLPLLPYIAVQVTNDASFVNRFAAVFLSIIFDIVIIVISNRLLPNIKAEREDWKKIWKGAEWSVVNRLKMELSLAESGDRNRETKDAVIEVIKTVDIKGSKRFAVALRGVISEKIDELIKKLKDKESALDRYGVNAEYIRKNIWMLFDLSQRAILALAQRVGVTPETAARLTRTAGFEIARGIDRTSAWRSIGENQFNQDLKTSKLSEDLIEQQNITAVLSAGQAIKQALSTLLPAIRGALLVLSLDIANRVEPARRNNLKARLVGRINTAYNPPVVVQKGQSIVQVVIDYLIRKELGIAADLFKKLPDLKKAREEITMAADSQRISDYKELIYAISQLSPGKRTAVIKVVKLFAGLKLKAEVAQGIEAQIMEIISRGGSVAFTMSNSDKAFDQMSLSGLRFTSQTDLRELQLGAHELSQILFRMTLSDQQAVLRSAVMTLENSLSEGARRGFDLPTNTVLVISGLQRSIGDVDSLIIAAEVINSFIGSYGDINNYAASFERQASGSGVFAVKAIVDIASALDKLASLGIKFIEPKNIYELFKLIKKMSELVKGLPILDHKIAAPLEFVFYYAEDLCSHLPRQIAMVISQMTYEDSFMDRQSPVDRKLIRYVSGARILWVIAKGIELLIGDKHYEDAIYLIRNAIGSQAESIESTVIMLNNMSPSAIGKIILSDKKITGETRFGEDLLRLDGISFDVFKGVIDWLISKGETEYAQAILDTVGKDALGNNIRAYLSTFKDVKKQGKIAQDIGKSFAKWPNREVVIGAIGLLDTEISMKVGASMHRHMLRRGSRSASTRIITSGFVAAITAYLISPYLTFAVSNLEEAENGLGVGLALPLIGIFLLIAIIVGSSWASSVKKKREAELPKGTVVSISTGGYIIVTIIGFVLAGVFIVGVAIPLLVAYWFVPAAIVVLWLVVKMLSGGSSPEKPVEKPKPAPAPSKSSSGNWATTAGLIFVIIVLALAVIAVLGSIAGETTSSPSPLPLSFSLMGLTASPAIFRPNISLPQYRLELFDNGLKNIGAAIHRITPKIRKFILGSFAAIILFLTLSLNVMASGPDPAWKNTQQYIQENMAKTHIVYKVKPGSGDNLWTIARDNGTTIEQIVKDTEQAFRTANPGAGEWRLGIDPNTGEYTGLIHGDTYLAVEKTLQNEQPVTPGPAPRELTEAQKRRIEDAEGPGIVFAPQQAEQQDRSVAPVQEAPAVQEQPQAPVEAEQAPAVTTPAPEITPIATVVAVIETGKEVAPAIAVTTEPQYGEEQPVEAVTGKPEDLKTSLIAFVKSHVSQFAGLGLLIALAIALILRIKNKAKKLIIPDTVYINLTLPTGMAEQCRIEFLSPQEVIFNGLYYYRVTIDAEAGWANRVRKGKGKIPDQLEYLRDKDFYGRVISEAVNKRFGNIGEPMSAYSSEYELEEKTKSVNANKGILAGFQEAFIRYKIKELDKGNDPNLEIAGWLGLAFVVMDNVLIVLVLLNIIPNVNVTGQEKVVIISGLLFCNLLVGLKIFLNTRAGHIFMHSFHIIRHNLIRDFMKVIEPVGKFLEQAGDAINIVFKGFAEIFSMIIRPVLIFAKIVSYPFSYMINVSLNAWDKEAYMSQSEGRIVSYDLLKVILISLVPIAGITLAAFIPDREITLFKIQAITGAIGITAMTILIRYLVFPKIQRFLYSRNEDRSVKDEPKILKTSRTDTPEQVADVSDQGILAAIEHKESVTSVNDVAAGANAGSASALDNINPPGPGTYDFSDSSTAVSAQPVFSPVITTKVDENPKVRTMNDLHLTPRASYYEYSVDTFTRRVKSLIAKGILAEEITPVLIRYEGYMENENKKKKGVAELEEKIRRLESKQAIKGLTLIENKRLDNYRKILRIEAPINIPSRALLQSAKLSDQQIRLSGDSFFGPKKKTFSKVYLISSSGNLKSTLFTALAIGLIAVLAHSLVVFLGWLIPIAFAWLGFKLRKTEKRLATDTARAGPHRIVPYFSKSSTAYNLDTKEGKVKLKQILACFSGRTKFQITKRINAHLADEYAGYIFYHGTELTNYHPIQQFWIYTHEWAHQKFAHTKYVWLNEVLAYGFQVLPMLLVYSSIVWLINLNRGHDITALEGIAAEPSLTVATLTAVTQASLVDIIDDESADRVTKKAVADIKPLVVSMPKGTAPLLQTASTFAVIASDDKATSPPLLREHRLRKSSMPLADDADSPLVIVLKKIIAGSSSPSPVNHQRLEPATLSERLKNAKVNSVTAVKIIALFQEDPRYLRFFCHFVCPRIMHEGRLATKHPKKEYFFEGLPKEELGDAKKFFAECVNLGIFYEYDKLGQFSIDLESQGPAVAGYVYQIWQAQLALVEIEKYLSLPQGQEVELPDRIVERLINGLRMIQQNYGNHIPGYLIDFCKALLNKIQQKNNITDEDLKVLSGLLLRHLIELFPEDMPFRKDLLVNNDFSDIEPKEAWERISSFLNRLIFKEKSDKYWACKFTIFKLYHFSKNGLPQADDILPQEPTSALNWVNVILAPFLAILAILFIAHGVSIGNVGMVAGLVLGYGLFHEFAHYIDIHKISLKGLLEFRVKINKNGINIAGAKGGPGILASASLTLVFLALLLVFPQYTLFFVTSIIINAVFTFSITDWRDVLENFKDISNKAGKSVSGLSWHGLLINALIFGVLSIWAHYSNIHMVIKGIGVVLNLDKMFWISSLIILAGAICAYIIQQYTHALFSSYNYKTQDMIVDYQMIRESLYAYPSWRALSYYLVYPLHFLSLLHAGTRFLLHSLLKVSGSMNTFIVYLIQSAYVFFITYIILVTPVLIKYGGMKSTPELAIVLSLCIGLISTLLIMPSLGSIENGGQKKARPIPFIKFYIPIYMNSFLFFFSYTFLFLFLFNILYGPIVGTGLFFTFFLGSFYIIGQSIRYKVSKTEINLSDTGVNEALKKDKWDTFKNSNALYEFRKLLPKRLYGGIVRYMFITFIQQTMQRLQIRTYAASQKIGNEIYFYNLSYSTIFFNMQMFRLKALIFGSGVGMIVFGLGLAPLLPIGVVFAVYAIVIFAAGGLYRYRTFMSGMYNGYYMTIENRLNKLLNKHNSELSSEDAKNMKMAFEFLVDKTVNSIGTNGNKEAPYRKNGDFPIYHESSICQVLLELGISDPKAYIVAFLHDLAEDKKASIEKIEKKFGPEIAEYVNYLTIKKDELGTDVYKKEFFKKLYEHVANNPEHLFLILLKLADRIVSLRTFDVLSEESKLQNLEETVLILVYAELLGAGSVYATQIKDAVDMLGLLLEKELNAALATESMHDRAIKIKELKERLSPMIDDLKSEKIKPAPEKIEGGFEYLEHLAQRRINAVALIDIINSKYRESGRPVAISSEYQRFIVTEALRDEEGVSAITAGETAARIKTAIERHDVTKIELTGLIKDTWNSFFDIAIIIGSREFTPTIRVNIEKASSAAIENEEQILRYRLDKERRIKKSLQPLSVLLDVNEINIEEINFSEYEIQLIEEIGKNLPRIYDEENQGNDLLSGTIKSFSESDKAIVYLTYICGLLYEVKANPDKRFEKMDKFLVKLGFKSGENVWNSIHLRFELRDYLVEEDIRDYSLTNRMRFFKDYSITDIASCYLISAVHEDFSNREGYLGIIRMYEEAMVLDKFLDSHYAGKKFETGMSYREYAEACYRNYLEIGVEVAQRLNGAGIELTASEKRYMMLAELASLCSMCEPVGFGRDLVSIGILEENTEDSWIVEEFVSGLIRLRTTPYVPPSVSKCQSIANNQMDKLVKLSYVWDKGVKHGNALIMFLAFADKLAELEMLNRSNNAAFQYHKDRVSIYSEEIYAPLADRFKIGNTANKLRDRAQMLKDPKGFKEDIIAVIEFLKLKEDGIQYDKFSTEQVYKYYLDEGRSYIDEWTAKLQVGLAYLGIDSQSITGRVKTISSARAKLAYYKQERKKYDRLEDMEDYFGFRIILEDGQSIEDTISALEIIFEVNIPGEGIEYTNRPKRPYDVCHVNFRDKYDRPVEVQIYPTKEDFIRYQFGRGAHWIYKAKRIKAFEHQTFRSDPLDVTGNIIRDFSALWNLLNQQYVYPSIITRTSRGNFLTPVRVALRGYGGKPVSYTDIAASADIDCLTPNFAGVDLCTLDEGKYDRVYPSFDIKVLARQHRGYGLANQISDEDVIEVVTVNSEHEATSKRYERRAIMHRNAIKPRTFLKLHHMEPRKEKDFKNIGEHMLKSGFIFSASLENAARREQNMKLNKFEKEIIPQLVETLEFKNKEELYEWIGITAEPVDLDGAQATKDYRPYKIESDILDSMALCLKPFFDTDTISALRQERVAMVLDIDCIRKYTNRYWMDDMLKTVVEERLANGIPLFIVTAKAPNNSEGFNVYEFLKTSIKKEFWKDVYVVTSEQVNVVRLDDLEHKIFSLEFSDEQGNYLTWVGHILIENYGLSVKVPEDSASLIRLVVSRLCIVDDTDRNLMDLGGFNVGEDKNLGGILIGHMALGTLMVLTLANLKAPTATNEKKSSASGLSLSSAMALQASL